MMHPPGTWGLASKEIATSSKGNEQGYQREAPLCDLTNIQR